MPNVIDSLIIQLGLDTKGVGAGTKKAQDGLKGVENQAKKTGESLDKKVTESSQRTKKALDAMGASGENFGKMLGGAGEKAADGFAKARNQALSLLAVFTAGRGLKDFFNQTTIANSNLGYTAQRLNTNPQQLWAANHAVMAVGGGSNEVDSALGNIQQMGSTVEGSARLNNTFGQLGIQNYQELIRQGPEALLKAINRATQGMNSGYKNNLLGQLGFGPGTINLIDQTTSSFDKLIASKNGLAPTAKEISDSQQLMKDLRQFADVNDHFARVIEDEVAPAIDKVIVGITQWEQKNPELVKDIGEITLAVVGLGVALKAVGVSLGTISAARGAIALLTGAGRAGAVAEGAAGMLGRGGLGLAAGIGGRIIPAVGLGLLAAKLTSTGGIAERGIQAIGGDNNFTRWAFGDRQKGNSAKAMAILQSMGYSRNAALGIVGNIARESNFDPNALGDHETAYGLGQWHNDRVVEILKETGIDVREANFEDQVKAYALDIQLNKDKKIQRAKSILNGHNVSVAQSTSAIRQFYERPKDLHGNEDAKRYALAMRAAGVTSPVQLPANSTQFGDINVTVNGNADGKKIANDIHREITKTLATQNIYGQQ